MVATSMVLNVLSRRNLSYLTAGNGSKAGVRAKRTKFIEQLARLEAHAPGTALPGSQ